MDWWVAHIGRFEDAAGDSPLLSKRCSESDGTVAQIPKSLNGNGSICICICICIRICVDICKDPNAKTQQRDPNAKRSNCKQIQMQTTKRPKCKDMLPNTETQMQRPNTLDTIFYYPTNSGHECCAAVPIRDPKSARHRTVIRVL